MCMSLHATCQPLASPGDGMLEGDLQSTPTAVVKRNRKPLVRTAQTIARGVDEALPIRVPLLRKRRGILVAHYGGRVVVLDRA